jgi:hypothetical protein
MRKIRNFVLVILATLFVLLEELFWVVGEPIYNHLLRYNIYIVKTSEYVQKLNKYLILLIFLFFFVTSEIIGMYAVVMFSKVFLIGVALYVVKFIPVFVAFSVLEDNKEKLMSIKWFAVSYELVIKTIKIIKDSTYYKQVNAIILKIKEHRKNKLSALFSYLVTKIKVGRNARA